MANLSFVELAEAGIGRFGMKERFAWCLGHTLHVEMHERARSLTQSLEIVSSAAAQLSQAHAHLISGTVNWIANAVYVKWTTHGSCSILGTSFRGLVCASVTVC